MRDILLQLPLAKNFAEWCDRFDKQLATYAFTEEIYAAEYFDLQKIPEIVAESAMDDYDYFYEDNNWGGE